ncbi:MAG TPA: hypothetical protein VF303_02765 [Candidatus Nanoarchaeia archaeon]
MEKDPGRDDFLYIGFTMSLVGELRRLGYTNLTQRLVTIACCGTDDQQKRVADCWAILYFDYIGEDWRKDQMIRGFLKTLDEAAWLRPGDQHSLVFLQTKDRNAAWWWIKGAYDVLTHLVRSGEATPTVWLCLRMLGAVAPAEIVWNL